MSLEIGLKCSLFLMTFYMYCRKIDPELKSGWGFFFFFLLLLCVGVLLPFLILFFIADLTTSAFFILAGYLTCFVHACSDSLQIIHTTKRCHCSTVKGQTGPILNIHLHIYTPRRRKKVPLLLSKLVLLRGKPSVLNLHKTFQGSLRETNQRILLGVFPQYKYIPLLE